MNLRAILALGVAGMATIGLAAWMIAPAIYPYRVVLGYVPGTILFYEVQTTK